VLGQEQIYWAGFSEQFVIRLCFCGVGLGRKTGSLFGLGPVGYIVKLWDLHITFCVSYGEPIVVARFIVQSGVSFFSPPLLLFFIYISKFR
jgi:hypothetical protein